MKLIYQYLIIVWIQFNWIVMIYFHLIHNCNELSKA